MKESKGKANPKIVNKILRKTKKMIMNLIKRLKEHSQQIYQ